MNEDDDPTLPRVLSDRATADSANVGSTVEDALPCTRIVGGFTRLLVETIGEEAIVVSVFSFGGEPQLHVQRTMELGVDEGVGIPELTWTERGVGNSGGSGRRYSLSRGTGKENVGRGGKHGGEAYGTLSNDDWAAGSWLS